MPTGATGQLGLALPVQGELSGTWGNTVNNAITEYTNIAIAGTLTLTGDGAVTLANTTGTDLATNITSTLAGAGTVTAQFAIVRITGTTTTKVITGPSYSKTYLIDNASSFAVTFKASGQTGVSIAAGEEAIVFFNSAVSNADYVKAASSVVSALTGTLPVANGGTGQTSYTDGQLLIGNTTGNTLTKATLTAGSGVTITNGSGAITINATGSGGDVVGPASATANGIALFNSTTGKLIKDSAASDGLIYGLTVGRGAGAVSTNTAVGASALTSNTSGAGQTAVGGSALINNTTGANNQAFGYRALFGNTTGGQNIALGGSTLFTNTTGSNNTAVGDAALNINNGSSNVAVGTSALQLNTTASNNTAVGYQAGYSNTTGDGVAFFGRLAGFANTTGSSNVAMGNSALTANTTGSQNTAIGQQALGQNTTASNNTAVGYQAGYSNTTGTRNTLVGQIAGYALTTGGANVVMGDNAFKAATTGENSVAIGTYALSAATGNFNTAVGAGAGDSITSGAKNTLIGRYNGNQGGLDIRTASNYIVLSDGDGNPRLYNNATDWYDSVGKLRAVPQSGSSKTTSYTLATTDVGEYILLGASGAIVIPDATFAAGDVITIFNNTASTATITCSITTAYIAGTFTDKATMTLAAAGVATVLFITSTLCVVSGNVT